MSSGRAAAGRGVLGKRKGDADKSKIPDAKDRRSGLFCPLIPENECRWCFPLKMVSGPSLRDDHAAMLGLICRAHHKPQGRLSTIFADRGALRTFLFPNAVEASVDDTAITVWRMGIPPTAVFLARATAARKNRSRLLRPRKSLDKKDESVPTPYRGSRSSLKSTRAGFFRPKSDYSLDDSFVATRGVISRSHWSIPQWRMTMGKAIRALIDAVHTERFIYDMLNDFGCIDVYRAVQRLHSHLPKACASMAMEYLKPDSHINVCAVNGICRVFNFGEFLGRTDNFRAWLLQSVFKDSVSRVAVCRFSDVAHGLGRQGVPAKVSDVCVECQNNPPGSCVVCLPADANGAVVVDVPGRMYTASSPPNMSRAQHIQWIYAHIPSGWFAGVCSDRCGVRSAGNKYRRELVAAGFRRSAIDSCRSCASASVEE